MLGAVVPAHEPDPTLAHRRAFRNIGFHVAIVTLIILLIWVYQHHAERSGAPGHAIVSNMAFSLFPSFPSRWDTSRITRLRGGLHTGRPWPWC